MARSGRPNKSDPRVDQMSHDIKNGDNEKVKKLIPDVGIDACDSYLRTALINAACYKNNALLEWLIENNANINHQDRNGYSALHFCAQEKNEDGAKLLIQKGANLELKDIYGNSPLFKSILNAKGNYVMIKLLINNGANLDSVNNYQNTPRKMAASIIGFDLNSIIP